jgi:RNA polymerase sigma factor (sigma-70 family)
MSARTRTDAENPSDEAFSAAFSALYPLAVRLAARMVGDQAEAEDIAAEALARAYARWPKVSQLSYRDAWVMKVTGNLAIDTLRRRGHQPPPALTDEFEDAAALRTALAVALVGLPRRQRQAIVLRYLGGYTEVEVSSALGISRNSVKRHVQRGLAALRGRGLEDDIDGSAHAAV